MIKYLLCLLFISTSLSINAESFSLYLIRHAEKDLTTKTDPDLTDVGRETAAKLRDYLAQRPIAAIHSTNYKRTMNTALPVANSKQLMINLYDPRELKAMAKKLINAQQNALVVGHSNTTPELVALLGGDAKSIAEDEYGEIFIISIDSSSQLVKTQYHSL